MRKFKFISLAIAVIAGALLLTGPAAKDTVLAQGSNLLENPGFENGVYTFNPADYSWLALYGSQRESCMRDGTYVQCNTAQIPVGWIPWWINPTAEDPGWRNRMPEYKTAEAPYLNRVHSGNRAAQYFTFHSTHTAGLLQVVEVPAFANLRFSIWGQAWSSASDATFSDFPTPVNMRVGIDPTGGTNPYSGEIVWSDYYQPYDTYQQLSVEAQAQGDTVTVFLISAPDEARKHNDIYWDDAELVVTGAGTASTGGDTNNAAPPPPASLGPTATPDAEGVIYAEVQEGDSFWSVAARHGLTLEEIYELNDAGEGDFVRVGQLLIVGYSEDALPADAEATEEAEDGEAGAEETPTPEAEATPTPPPPTPTPAPEGGEICLSAYVDENQNAQRDAGEPLKESVAFTISSGEAVISNYVTDGNSEPYCITGLDNGNYRVTRSTAPGEVLTTSGEWAISLAEGMSQTLEFGSYVDAEAATAVATGPDESGNPPASVENAEPAPAEDGEGGMARILLIAAVVVAVLLLVGVLVIVLSVRRSSI